MEGASRYGAKLGQSVRGGGGSGSVLMLRAGRGRGWLVCPRAAAPLQPARGQLPPRPEHPAARASRRVARFPARSRDQSPGGRKPKVGGSRGKKEVGERRGWPRPGPPLLLPLPPAEPGPAEPGGLDALGRGAARGRARGRIRGAT